MPLTAEYLVGETEAFSDTVRALLAREWSLDHPPTIMSACGAGDNASKSHLTENDFLAARKGEDLNFVRVYDGDTTVTAATNQFVELESLVHIDVFARPSQITAYVDEVDRILWDAAPNNTTRVRKSGGSLDSAIWNFKEYTPDWHRIAEDREEGLPEQYAGTITILWQKTG